MKKTEYESAMEMLNLTYPKVARFFEKVIETNEKLVKENGELKMDNNRLRSAVETYYSVVSGGLK